MPVKSLVHRITTKKSAAALSVLSNACLILLKLAAGIITGSVSLIAEAVHSLMDLAAALIAYFSVRVADKPADTDHPYGHGKIENVSGLAEGLLIFIAAGIIVYEAIRKIIYGVVLEFLYLGIVVMAVSIVINILVSRHLKKVAIERDSLALEADALHLSTDVITMSGVLLALILVKLTGISILDPIAAVIVAVLICWAAFRITRKSLSGLMDAKLPKEEEEKIKAIIMDHGRQLVGFHNLRTRKVGSVRQIDLHMVMPRQSNLVEVHDICDHIESDIKANFPEMNITIHAEPCDNSSCSECGVMCDENNLNAHH